MVSDNTNLVIGAGGAELPRSRRPRPLRRRLLQPALLLLLLLLVGGLAVATPRAALGHAAGDAGHAPGCKQSASAISFTSAVSIHC